MVPMCKCISKCKALIITCLTCLEFFFKVFRSFDHTEHSTQLLCYAMQFDLYKKKFHFGLAIDCPCNLVTSQNCFPLSAHNRFFCFASKCGTPKHYLNELIFAWFQWNWNIVSRITITTRKSGSKTIGCAAFRFHDVANKYH